MSSKIVFVTTFPAAADFARELVPTGYELIITEARSSGDGRVSGWLRRYAGGR